MTTAPLPDAARANWVDRLAPAWSKPWLKLGRFDRPTGIWLLMLPGWQGIAVGALERREMPDWRLLIAFFIGAALMRAAGCAYNDIVDRDIDAKVFRTANRPIPAGQISVKQAWAFIVACCLLSALVLWPMGNTAIFLALGSFVLVAAYPFMKRVTWWPQAWLGLTFNWGALMGCAAATAVTNSGYFMWRHPHAPNDFGDMGHVSVAGLLLYVGGLFWTLGYDTIYAIQDLEDDALAGVKSSARRLGDTAPRAIRIFYGLAVIFAVLAAWEAQAGLLFVPFLALYATLLWLQTTRVKLDQPAVALALFKSNTWAGLLLFAALAAGAVRL